MKEFLKRWGMPTSKFFKNIMLFSGVLAAVGAYFIATDASQLPQFKFVEEIKIAGKWMAWASGLIALIVAKLTVKNPVQMRVELKKEEQDKQKEIVEKEENTAISNKNKNGDKAN